MTEPNTPSTSTEVAVEKVENNTPTPPQKKGSGTLLGLVAIVLVIALAVGLYFHGHKQGQEQLAVTQKLETQLTDVRNSLNKDQQRMTQALENRFNTLQTEQQKALQDAQAMVAAQTQELEKLQAKIATISSADTKTWLLAQAEFLVKLAGRKLWVDQDVTSAATLLKSADASLAEMNDPSLFQVRKAITDDLSSIAAISQVDFDGITLKLFQLSRQVDNLRLADTDKDDAPMDETSGDVSSSFKDWRQNLSKSWKSFASEFVTVRRRDDVSGPLLAPGQDFYLRENLRSRLLVAAQAVPRHQNEVFRESLETVSTWVRAYFDPNDNDTKVFLDELDELSQQSVNMDVPDKLSSQPLLEELVRTRVRNLLMQPAAESKAQEE